MVKLEFTNVLYVPSLSSNLFSILYLTMHCSFTIFIKRDTLHFIWDNKILFQANVSPSNSAFLLRSTISVQQIASLSSSLPLPLDLSLWHCHLCHQHLAGVKKLLSDNLVMGFRLDSQADPDSVCEACKAGKMHANPFPISHSRASQPLQLIHSDIHGPVKVPTYQRYHYWVIFIDDFSRFKAVYLLKWKSETFAAFKQFKAWAENVTGQRLGCLHDDKGGEYMSREFEAFCIDHGIQRQHSAQNRPQQNGIISERADFDKCFFINQRHSTPQIPPPHPQSLLEPSSPSICLLDIVDDAPEYPSHSQLPVYGGDSPSASEQPPAHSLTPPSPNIFHTAPGSTSLPTSSSSSASDSAIDPSSVIAPAPSCP
jgi:hypothetical protein